MVLSTKIDSIHVHAAIVGPVVCKSNDEFDSGFLSSSHHLVEWLKVDCGLSIVPPLQNNLGFACAFSSILWESTGNRRYVSVVETPGAKGIQTGLFSRCKPEFHVRLVLQDQSVGIACQGRLSDVHC